jgi:hypothetical protein
MCIGSEHLGHFHRCSICDQETLQHEQFRAPWDTLFPRRRISSDDLFRRRWDVFHFSSLRVLFWQSRTGHQYITARRPLTLYPMTESVGSRITAEVLDKILITLTWLCACQWLHLLMWRILSVFCVPSRHILSVQHEFKSRPSCNTPRGSCNAEAGASYWDLGRWNVSTTRWIYPS